MTVVTATRSKRPLGDMSAENDPKFTQYFVDTTEFALLLSDECMIVFGAKGSGKTAIMRALSDIPEYSARYACVQAVKLDGLRFGPLFDAMKKLNNTSHQGIVAIARAAWQNVIAVYVLEALLETRLLPAQTRSDIQRYLRSTGHLGTPVASKLGSHLERVWELIVKWSRDNEASDTPQLLGLSTRQQLISAQFPMDDKLDRLLSSAMRAVRQERRRVMVCLDGLDSVIEHSIESRDYIFAGLIDATFKCKTDHNFADTLAMKVLLPKELAHGAKRLLRDLDKAEQVFENIHWTHDALGDFMKKRLEDHIRAKNRDFREVWREYFQDKIRNDVHLVEEDSFTYFLRHTLYRPRQVLIHVQAVLDAWDRRAETVPFRVDPTFIPKVVAETNVKLSQYVINELQLDFPHLEKLMRSFRGLPSVISAADVRERLQRFLGLEADRVDEAFTDLYNYGLFGISQATGEAELKKNAAFKFSFMTPEYDGHEAASAPATAFVAISPMFVDYCGCKSSTAGVVNPVASG
jgi:hypothetical protein